MMKLPENSYTRSVHSDGKAGMDLDCAEMFNIDMAGPH